MTEEKQDKLFELAQRWVGYQHPDGYLVVDMDWVDKEHNFACILVLPTGGYKGGVWCFTQKLTLLYGITFDYELRGGLY